MENEKDSETKEKAEKRYPWGVVLVTVYICLLAGSRAIGNLLGGVDSHGNHVFSFNIPLILISIASIYVAIRMYQGKNWARWLITIGSIAYFPLQLGRALLAEPKLLFLSLLAFLLILPLFTPKANQYFKEGHLQKE